MMPAEDLVARLRLKAHAEGGWYRETWRSVRTIEAPQGSRSAGTAILYLLAPGTFSAFHRVASDELWHHYQGAPVELHVLTPHGSHARWVLGPDLSLGEVPQVVVPAGCWQAARSTTDAAALCGCTMAPGFDAADFELARRRELIAEHPNLRDLIESLTRE